MLVLRVSRRREFAATVLVPAIAALLGGLYIDDLAVRDLLPLLGSERAWSPDMIWLLSPLWPCSPAWP